MTHRFKVLLDHIYWDVSMRMYYWADNELFVSLFDGQFNFVVNLQKELKADIDMHMK